VRSNRGVNRGYRDQFFRDDDSSVTIQAAGTPVIFRGDRLPKALQGQAFISDSGTNLVHAYRIRDDGLGRLRAEDLYQRGEIFASWDERCRPVNLASAPDGTLYVVDMYRGVVQDGVYWTEFLRDYIKSRDLELPVKRGRIWRIVHDNMRPAAAPRLSSATAVQLLEFLSHPNGWWRDTAQQLLVQRGDKTIVPQLRDLTGRAPDWRTRLHALWTLDGLDALEPAQVERALSDKSAEVRASAVRLSERWLGDPGQPIAASALRRMDDASWTVRRQVAASLGTMPLDSRLDRATAMLEKYGSDPVVVDATISGLRGSETDVFDRLLRLTSARGSRERTPLAGRGGGRGLAASGGQHVDPVTMLAAAIARSGDPVAVQQLIGRATAPSDQPWQRLAMLNGLDAGLTAPGGRGRGSRTIALNSEPTALLRLAATDTQMGRLGESVANRITWPGKPAPIVTVPPLTPAERRRFDAGAELYKNLCIACHQADGRGREKLAPPLVGSRFVVAADPANAARIVLGGMEGPIGLMPPLAAALNDEQVAAALTYIRREWGHTASAVAPDDVQEIRGLTRTRTRPWTAAELPQGRGGRAGGAQ
jgi:mono/diheme cytochrome c family protein/HEAT repeat protein